MITYQDTLSGISAEMLKGFFVGWPKHPSPERHFELLRQSAYVMLAKDDETGRVIGFITAITDHVLSAYIPLLEVLPEYQGKGIGKELTTRMLKKLDQFYMVDLICDPDVQPFYEKVGMSRYTCMKVRNFDRQDGIEA